MIMPRRRVRVGCAAAIAIMVSLTACNYAADGPYHPLGPLHGPDPSAQPATVADPLPDDPPPGTPGQAARHMRVWQDFPVDADPRPIVLAGAIVHRPQEYTSTVDLSFADPTTLPDGPDEADGYPVIGAREALEVMHDIARKHPRDRRHVVLTDMKFPATPAPSGPTGG